MKNNEVDFNSYFDNVLPLSYENALIVLKDAPFPIFDKDNQIWLNRLCNVLSTIADKVHDCLLIECIFTSIPPEQSPLSHYQLALIIITSIIKDSIGINNKSLILRYPQLIHDAIDLDYDIEITYSFNQSTICQDDSHTWSIKDLSSPVLLNRISSIIKSANALNQDYKTYSYDSVCFGGSFDHYHLGHNTLLYASALMANESISIGVTSDDMISKKGHPSLLQSCSYRIDHIRKILGLLTAKASKVSVTAINDPVSFSGTSTDLQALLLTTETYKGGEAVNNIRKENNVPPLDLITLDVIDDDSTTKISSTTIRNDILKKVSNETLVKVYDLWKEMITPYTCSNKLMKIDYWWSFIRDHYMESWRYYHTLRHIHQMLHEIGKDESIEMKLAIWFHDIVYVPSRNDNEERSIQLMKVCLVDIFDFAYKIDINKIVMFINETRFHKENKEYDDAELNMFLDLDLSILTKDDQIDKYQEDIRKEYFYLSHSDWVKGRIDFLTTMKNKKSIFRSPKYQALNSKAISNIDKMIASLNKSVE